MSSKFLLVAVIAYLSAVPAADADEFSYNDVAERFGDTRLAVKDLQEAKMHGECLVGLKRLIFVKRDNFDPVADWINYRTISLLEQFPPCTVLITMEVARDELMSEDEQP